MGAFMSEGMPVLLQTVTLFEGRGLLEPLPLGLSYTVPEGRTAGMLYFRAGSSVTGLVNISLIRDGTLMRYFPVGPSSAVHVQLAIVEELPPRTQLEVLAAGEGAGTLILDIGFIEI